MKRNAKKPLMYINQPDMESPKASMQQHYVSSKKKKSEEGNKDEPAPKSEKPPIKRRSGKYKSMKHKEKTDVYDGEDEQESFDKYEAHDDKYEEQVENTTEKDTDSHRRKSFKEMSLEEKISYFVDTPSYAPRLRCEIKTDQKSYRGVLTDWVDEDVYIRTGNRKTSTRIAFSTIKDIQILGF